MWCRGRRIRCGTGSSSSGATVGTWRRSTQPRRRVDMRRLTMSVSLAAVSLLVWAGSALAAGDGEKVGRNLGDLLGGWSKSLYGGIAGLVALVFLLNRRFADLAVF